MTFRSLFALVLLVASGLVGCQQGSGAAGADADLSTLKTQPTEAQLAYVMGYRFGEQFAQDSTMKAHLDAFLEAFRVATEADSVEADERMAYAQGLIAGRQFAEDTTAMRHVDLFVAAFRAAASGDANLYSEREMTRLLRAYQDSLSLVQLREQAAMNPQAKAYLDLLEGNTARADSFLAANRSKPGVQTTPSGLQYEVLTPGNGPRPTDSSTVVVHYEGRMISGEVFDSSLQRGEPATFEVDGLVEGMSEGLKLMPVGSKYRFYIPPALGYGMGGAQGSPIGPNELLIFEFELLDLDPQTNAPMGAVPPSM